MKYQKAVNAMAEILLKKEQNAEIERLKIRIAELEKAIK